jgi:hypothetical protein
MEDCRALQLDELSVLFMELIKLGAIYQFSQYIKHIQPDRFSIVGHV